MKKIVFLLVIIMVLATGCKGKQSENTALEKGTMPTEKVVITDGKVTSGWAAWNKFFAETTGAKESEHATVERVINIEYSYNEVLKDGIEATHYEIELRFEDEKYVYKNLTEGVYKTYEYLVEKSGQYKNAAIKTKGYYLVNDKDVTYDELAWSVLSSQSTDWIDHMVIFTETVE